VVSAILLVQPLELRPEQSFETFLVDAHRLLEAGDEGREFPVQVVLLIDEFEQVTR
jgi:hypothetical protein